MDLIRKFERADCTFYSTAHLNLNLLVAECSTYHDYNVKGITNRPVHHGAKVGILVHPRQVAPVWNQLPEIYLSLSLS